MAHNIKQMELNSTEEVNVEMRRSFSWDRAFFTSDGFLDAEELSNVIEGSGDDVTNQLQKFEEIECLEAKLFEEIEASTRASNISSSSIEASSGRKDSQAKKKKAASNVGGSGGSQEKKVKSPVRKSASFKTGKGEGDSPSKTSAGIKKRNNLVVVSTRMLKTPPASPGSSGSSSSTFSVNQLSKRSSSAPRRTSVNNEKPSAINARRNNEWKMMKNKVVRASSRMSNTPPGSPGSSGSTKSTFSVNQRSTRSSSAPRRTSVYSEKPSGINAQRDDEWKTTKSKVVRASSRMSNTPPASPGSSGSSKSTFTINQRSKRSSSAPRRTSVNTEKPSASDARRNGESKTVNKVVQASSRMSRTPPASPKASGSSSSTFSVNQRSKRSSSAPRRSSVNNEKPMQETSATNARKTDEWKINKPEVRLIPKTQSSIRLKFKPPPVVSLPTSPLGLFNSSASSKVQRSESSSPSSSSASSQRSTKPMVRSKSALKHRPTGQTPDQNRKQPVASHAEIRSPNASKTRKLISQKTTTPKPSRKQASVKEKSSSSMSKGAENVILVSPEVMDIKGKLNALKMEISMQKGRQIQENRNEPG